ncbi:hypothetical protein Achl_0484 [Pseudarthrobacter chlorophenolicus A6]|uniref:Uncharacterized protein n=1 Tax=Pseudarthrobacter chlorophenolicus (strain ATCC 700700 / DSM 12829 / CIP 107037 / JCM 12360 / KCTC 9906 / NCIMB 13794 / A6) TaxID=452863 RepID=B8HAM2_PSECP|nr:hypothetical protein Achl_0484 [Pseudarthrobacter chlorophenolicus A6]SDQ47818.1 hypothetical protein SAMN04489738_1048 [Pseudarthrobacter chlorophenolicus]
MAGRERGKTVREDSEEPGNDAAGNADSVAPEKAEEVDTLQPARRVPGINGYDPTQWPDARP